MFPVSEHLPLVTKTRSFQENMDEIWGQVILLETGFIFSKGYILYRISRDKCKCIMFNESVVTLQGLQESCLKLVKCFVSACGS